MTFTLAASGASQVTDLQLRIGLADPVDTRDGLDEIAAEESRTATDYPRPVVDNLPLRAGAVLAGPDSQEFTVGPFDVSRLVRGSSPRAVPMRIGVSGVVDGTRQTVAFVHTFLVWAPSTASTPTPVSVLVTLADRPRVRSDGKLTDYELAELTKLITPGGRLYELLYAVLPAVGGPIPTAALALDPVLLEALQTMAGGQYTVVTPSGETLVAGKDSWAETFLSDLRGFGRAGGTLIALPYGDADLAALLTADNRHTALTSVDAGRATVNQVLGGDVLVNTTVAYPAGGLIDPGPGSLLHDPRFGFQTLVMDDRVAAAKPGLSYTPAAAFDVSTQTGTMRLLAADHDLTEAVAFPTGETPIALQTVLAELAVITSELPSEARPQLVALPHDWNPADGWASTVMEALLQPSQVAFPDRLLTEPPAGGPERSVGVYPDWALRAQLPTSYVDGIDDIWAQAHRLASVLCGVEPPASPTTTDDAIEAWRTCWDQAMASYQRALLRAASVFWRNDPGPGELIGQQVLSDLNLLRGGIQVVASRIVTLTSNSGRVPVTVENNTERTVSVVLALSSTDPTRVRSATRVERTIPPLQKIQVEIDVDAESAGTFPVDIRLLTPAGEPLVDGPAVRVLVRSSAYGVVAIGITVGAVAVLFLAVGLRTLRRLRARRPAAGPAADETAGGTVTDGGAYDGTPPRDVVTDSAPTIEATPHDLPTHEDPAPETATREPFVPNTWTKHATPSDDTARDRWYRGEPPAGPTVHQPAGTPTDSGTTPWSRR